MLAGIAGGASHLHVCVYRFYVIPLFDLTPLIQHADASAHGAAAPTALGSDQHSQMMNAISGGVKLHVQPFVCVCVHYLMSLSILTLLLSRHLL